MSGPLTTSSTLLSMYTFTKACTAKHGGSEGQGCGDEKGEGNICAPPPMHNSTRPATSLACRARQALAPPSMCCVGVSVT